MLVSLASKTGTVMQAYQQQLDEINVRLTAIADYGDELKQLKTKHEMTAKQNAAALIRLQVRHKFSAVVHKSSACLPASLSACQSFYKCIIPLQFGVSAPPAATLGQGYKFACCKRFSAAIAAHDCLITAPVQPVGGVFVLNILS